MSVAIPSPLRSLHPGEWYVGGDCERLHTVLGSCVALCAWHPQLKLGGMCHYLLPQAPARASSNDARYAVNALKNMKAALLTYAALSDYQLGLFGGGEMFSFEAPRSIGSDNIAYARDWLAREHLQAVKVDVGGSFSRSLVLIMATGEIQLKRYQMNS